MAYVKSNKTDDQPFLSRPEVGSALTILSGLSFLLTGMLLPLVGKAGAKVSHYGTNFTAFLIVLLITLTLSGLAVRSKLERRSLDGSPRPLFSMVIFGLSVILLLALMLGLLKI
jgi:hypothetical protein